MTEIKCNHCGSSNVVNDGTQYQCLACGKIVSVENINQNGVQNNNQVPQQYDVNQQNDYNQQYNANQQQIPMKSKSMAISLILSFLFLGIGLAYLGLVKRWLVAVVIAIVLTMLIAPIGIIWNLYLLYDTYACTNAINNAQSIPKLAGFIDIN